MASFVYVARETGSGREVRSSVEAATEQAAIAALLNRNMLVVSIQEKVGKKGKTSGGRVALGDLVIFTRQLATMVDAGLAMVQSLQGLAEQTTHKIMRDVIKDVCTRVEGGDSFSEALQKHPKVFSRLYVCMVAAGGGLYGWFYFIKTKAGREFWDNLRLKLPIVGVIGHKICLARFTRTLASLIRSGVPILEVLQIVSQTVGNVVMEKAIRTAAVDIERGESISAALSKHPIFPGMILRMITAGEQTGRLDNMLERIADFLDEEIETTLAGLTALIEPILIVFLGIVIGGMVICMFLPIFKLPEIVNTKH